MLIPKKKRGEDGHKVLQQTEGVRHSLLIQLRLEASTKIASSYVNSNILNLFFKTLVSYKTS